VNFFYSFKIGNKIIENAFEIFMNEVTIEEKPLQFGKR